MKGVSPAWLRTGGWLLNRRWWWISLASLSVFYFEFMEYRPFDRGVEISFVFEITFYGIILPLSTGLALSWLATSRAELAWSTYYQNLIPNLNLQLNNAHTYGELADVFLQFVRVVIPVIGARIYKYEQNSLNNKTVLNWPAENDLPLLDSNFACATDVCPFISLNKLETDTRVPQLCHDPHVVTSSQNSRYFCQPFVFSNSLIAGARFYFPPDSQLSAEQLRLLKEIAPIVAAAFKRIQLESLMERQNNQINTEQRRIARDVHDTLGHSLAYLRLRLDQISSELKHGESSTLQKEVTILRDVAKEAYEQMRDMLITLSPNTDLNINDTLEKYAERISIRANFKLNIHHSGKPRNLPPPVQRNVINIFREILTNIENHAHAHQVDLDLNWEKKCFEVKVQDNGVGFDPALPVEYGHFGLNNMRERSLESNIQFSLSSQVGNGTELIVRVPYEEES